MKKPNTSKRLQTDGKRLQAMRDDGIDYSDIPPVSPEMFARGVLRRGLKPVPRKQQLTLRIDADVVEWYKAQGLGYQTRINALLRAYMEESRKARA